MTIFKKSLITLGAAVLIFSAVFIISTMVFMNHLYYDVNMAGLRNTARTLFISISEDRLTEILADNGDRQVNVNFPFSVGSAYRLTLVNKSGYVLWDSHVADRLVNHIDREEISAALDGREGTSRRDSISTGMRQIYYALPVFDKSGNVLGAFRLSISIPEFSVRISPIIIPFIIFIIIFIIAAFWVIILYSRSLSLSLERLVRIAQSGAFYSYSEDTQNAAPNFISLEKTMRAMTEELNRRFEIAKSENTRLETILNGMSEIVFAADSSLKLLLVNPKARELFALDDRLIISMTLLEATRSAELADLVKKAIQEGSPVNAELTFHSGVKFSEKQKNAEQYFLVNISPLASSGGSPGGVVVMMQEITRLVKLERVRKDFVANVSHELRTPIQLIKGFSENLSDEVSENFSGDKNRIIQFIEIIRKNAGIMENLTNDLLLLSSLENNVIHSRNLEIFSAEVLIDEAVSAVKRLVEKKHIEIITDCAENLSAKLYGSLIVQALINLTENAVKFSQDNSKIWINAYKENENIIFEVRDKGIGILPEHQERIFERFYRVDRARSRAADNEPSHEIGGTGLGLSIVRHIALLHKGSVEVESRAGEGSIFKIKIPTGE